MIGTTPTSNSRNFMKRMLRNEAGNTLAIVAAALVPMTAMVGGGVDLSRGYMAQARLQQACDAAVLAGRKAAGDGAFDTDAEARSRTFFDANFPEGFQSTTNRTFDPGSLDGGTTVTATATATLPTVVMKAFGKEKIELTATCDARLEVNNSDIMMVLDTTGSMVCTPEHTTSQCQTYIADNGLTETGSSRIVGLRSALTSFNGILAAAAAGTNVRIRYGFVPYSGTVNVGKLLYAVEPSYLIGGSNSESHTYQSRRPVYGVNGSPITTTETMQFYRSSDGITYPAFSTSSECTKYQNNQQTSIEYYRSLSWRSNTWTPSMAGYSGSGNPLIDGINKAEFSAPTSGGWASPNGRTTSYKTCKRSVKKSTTTYTYDGNAVGAYLAYYEHANLSWPVSDYVETGISGGTVTLPVDNQLASPREVTWAGCIEERNTVNVANFTYNTESKLITPTGATDLDIDNAPTDDITRWRPYWPEVTYHRGSSTSPNNAVVNYNPIVDQYATDSGDFKSQVACPHDAQLLTEMDSTAFSAYTNSLFANGGTYHNTGMIWGARLASPDGIFSENVNEEPTNQSFVSRHMILMTDGQMDAGATYYSMYGVDKHDRKISTDGLTTTLNDRHERRFSAMCEAVKAKGIRIWVIAFSTGLSTALNNCASTIGENPDGTPKKATYSSSNSAALNTAFVEIAQSIADLRLSK